MRTQWDFFILGHGKIITVFICLRIILKFYNATHSKVVCCFIPAARLHPDQRRYRAPGRWLSCCGSEFYSATTSTVTHIESAGIWRAPWVKLWLVVIGLRTLAAPGPFGHPEGRWDQHLGIPITCLWHMVCFSTLFCDMPRYVFPRCKSWHTMFYEIFRKIVIPNPGLLEDR